VRLSVGISIDVDSVASHLRGYGINDSSDEASVYRIAVPRAAELLKELNIRATFFFVAEEAERYPELLRSLVTEGHEIASHSYSHPMVAQGDWRALKQSELVRAKELLQSISGTQILGFRAPGWEGSTELWQLLAETEHLYDASIFPSWFFLLIQSLVGRRFSLGSRELKLAFANKAVSVEQLGGGRRLVSIPVSCSQFCRLPYYHTLKLKLPAFVFSLIRWSTLQAEAPINYTFHAVDFLGLDEIAEKRIKRHPGMKLALSKKLHLARTELLKLQRSRKPVTLSMLAQEALQAY